MADSFVIDACALIAVVTDEEGSDILADKFTAALERSASTTLLMHKLNLLEVYYDLYRRSGKEVADSLLEEMRDNPVVIVSDISDEVFREAGRLKASYPLSLADSFAVALAKTRGATLITSDHHEFDVLQTRGEVSILWIR
jgi:predicted nucleic acid-binding protein